MKKLYLLIFLFTLVSTVNLAGSPYPAGKNGGLTGINLQQSTTDVIVDFPWFEDFEGGIPEGWSQSGTMNWTLNNGGNGGVPSAAYSGSQNMYLFSSSTHTVKLITPEFDLSGLSEPSLSFWHTQGKWASDQDILKVYYRNGEDGEWVELIQYTNDIPNWTSEKIELSEIDILNPIQFAFEGTTDYGRGVCIDDVAITDGDCESVTGLQVSDITESAARLSWDAGEIYTQWRLSYRAQSEEDWTSITVNINEYDFPDNSLEPNTNYIVRVEGLCSDGNFSIPVSINFRTQCVITLPLYENFDMSPASTTAGAPYCWSFIKEYTSASANINGTAFTSYFTGNYFSYPNSYYMYNGYPSSTSELALISPRLPEEVVNLQVDFMAKGSGAIEVGYVVREDPFNFIPCQRFTIASTTSWTSYSVNFDTVTTEAYIIAFRHAHSGTGQSMYLDNIMIDLRDNCDTRLNSDSIRFSNITSSSASISYGTTDIITSGDVMYREVGVNDWIIEEGVTFPHILNSLEDTKQYEVAIRTDCGNGKGFWSIPVRFWTAFMLPIVENFDDNDLSGWTVIKDRKIAPGTINPSTTYVSSPYGLTMSNSSNLTTDSMYFVSPPINPDMPYSNLQIRFRARASVANLNLSVGIIDNQDIHSFNLVQNLRLTTDYKIYIVSFEEYMGENRHIALGHNNPTTYSSIYIDDIHIEEIPACGMVTSVTASMPTGDGFTVDWRDVGVSDYIVEYRKTYSSDDFQTEYANGNSYTFYGLDELTDYTVRVKGDCDTEIWSDSIVMNTLIESVPVDFIEDFENQDSRWVFINGTQKNQWNIGADSVANNNEGDYCLYISDSIPKYRYSISGSPTAISNVFAFKPLLFDEATQYHIEYDWKGLAESCCDYMQVWLAPADIKLTAGTAPTTSGWKNLYGTSNLNSSASWKNNAQFFDVNEPGVYNLVIYWRNDNSIGTQPPAAIDNIKVEKVLCPPITNAVVKGVTKESIDIHFNLPNNSITQDIRFYYKVYNCDTCSLDSMDFNVPDPDLQSWNCTLTGLEPSTEYEITFRTLCSTGDEGFIMETLRAKTDCEEYPLPWMEKFDNTTFPPTTCWNRKSALVGSETLYTFEMPTGSDWTRVSTNGDFGARINIYGTAKRGWLITPSFLVEEGDPYYLQFDVKLVKYNQTTPPTFDNDDRFIVLISTDAGISWDIANAVIWGNSQDDDYQYNSLNENYQLVTIPLEDYSGTIKIAFYGESTISTTGVDNDLFIDNISIGKCPSRPGNFQIDEITNQTTRLIWQNITDYDSEWDIQYGNVGFVPDDNGTRVNDTTYVLTGLTPNTSYDAYVRSACSNGEIGAWYKIGTFTTTCDPYTVPFTETFDATETQFECWRIINNNDANSWARNTNNPYSGTHCMNYTTALSNDDYLVFPPIQLTGDELLTYLISVRDNTRPVKYSVLISTTGGQAKDFETVLLEETINLNAYREKEIDLRSYSGTVYLAFKISNQSTSGGILYVDDVIIDAYPTCKKPVDVTVSEDNAGVGIDMAWTERNNANRWEIEYVPEGSAIGQGTRMVANTNNPFNLTSVPNNTAHEFYVRSICGASDTSKWSVKEKYAKCDPVTTFPFFEGFEGSGEFLQTCGWSEQVLSGSINWNCRASSSDYSGAHTGSYHALFKGSARTGISKLISPVLDLTQLHNPHVIFWYAQKIWSSDQDILKVYYRTSPTSQWVLLKTYSSSVISWTRDSLILPNPSATYQIAFEGNENYGYGNAIDDITVKGAEPCPGISNLQVSFITQNRATVTWNTNPGDISWILEYRRDDENGFTSIPCNEPYQIIPNLQSETLYHVQVSALCNEGGSSLPVTTTFTTRDDRAVFHYINATAGSNGQINPRPGQIPVEAGHSQQFTITPDANYQIESIVVNGRNIGRISPNYTFNNVRGDSTLHVTFKRTGTGIEENSIDNHIAIFPNPTNHLVNIKSDIQFESVEILNMLGQVIYHNSISDLQFQINVESYDSGIYFVRMKGAKGTVTKKLIKE